MDYNNIDFSIYKQDGFTKKDILDYWEHKNYLEIRNMDIEKLCKIWAEEEGIELPEDFYLGKFNSELFKKVNSNKSVTCQILTSLKYSSIPVEELTFDYNYSIKRAKELYIENGNTGVIRGRQFAGGGATFILKSEEDIEKAIKFLHTIRKETIMPLFSPYYEANIEYGVFMIGNEVGGVVVKEKNPENGLHNLTQGANAYLLKDDKKIEELKSFCKDIPKHFNTGFIRIDVMETENNGLQIVELSVPNFKKFSILNPVNFEHGKSLFLKYYKKFYQK